MPGLAVIVDNRADEAMRFVIQQTHQCLPDSWSILWIHGSHTPISHVLDQLTPAAQQRIQCQRMEQRIFTVQDYNRLCLNMDFWRQMTEEWILIFQRDGCPLHMSPHSIEDFQRLNYDYIGAPWVWGRAPEDPFYNQVGNGGFSLRKRSAMLYALEQRPVHADSTPEDTYFGVHCKDLLDVAPMEWARAFSVEDENGYLVPFGFHKYRAPQVSRGSPEATYLFHTY
jgi:Protein of unknown function (DUF5672)